MFVFLPLKMYWRVEPRPDAAEPRPAIDLNGGAAEPRPAIDLNGGAAEPRPAIARKSPSAAEPRPAIARKTNRRAKKIKTVN